MPKFMNQKKSERYEREERIEKKILQKIAGILRQEHFLTTEEEVQFNQRIQET